MCTKWYSRCMRLHDTIHIAAPVADVWSLTVDVERWPEITPTTITAVRRLDDGPLRVGSTARLRQPLQRPRVWTVVELVEEERFVWEAKLATVRMRGEHVLAPTAEGCTNTLALELTGPGSGLLGRMLRRRFAEVLATENAGFARVARGKAGVGEAPLTVW